MPIALPTLWRQILDAIHAFQYAGVRMADEMIDRVATLPGGRRADRATFKLEGGVSEAWLVAYLSPGPLREHKLRAEVCDALRELAGLDWVRGHTGPPQQGPFDFLRPDGIVVSISADGSEVRVGPFPHVPKNPDDHAVIDGSSTSLTLHQTTDASGRRVAGVVEERYWRLEKDGLAARRDAARADHESRQLVRGAREVSAAATKCPSHAGLDEIQRKLDEFAGIANPNELVRAAALAGMLLLKAREAGAFGAVSWIELEPCFRQHGSMSAAPLADDRRLFACVAARLAQSRAGPAVECRFRAEPPHPGQSYDWDWLRHTLRAFATLVRIEGARLGARDSGQSLVPAADIVSKHTLAELERVTPPFHRSNGQWVKNKRAAEMEGVLTRTLADYRVAGVATADGRFGSDTDGRIWRRPGTVNSHPWYLVSSLKNK